MKNGVNCGGNFHPQIGCQNYLYIYTFFWCCKCWFLMLQLLFNNSATDLPMKNSDQKFSMFLLIQEFYIWIQNLNSICNKQKWIASYTYRLIWIQLNKVPRSGENWDVNGTVQPTNLCGAIISNKFHLVVSEPSPPTSTTICTHGRARSLYTEELLEPWNSNCLNQRGTAAARDIIISSSSC